MTHDRALGVTHVEGVRFGDYAARIYCEAHHKHINRTIENRPTRDLIKALFSGTATTLDREAQSRIAAWAAKTCYAQWGMVRRRQGVPISHRRCLVATAAPHPSVYVSISRCTGERVRVIFARQVIKSADDGRVSRHYDFVLALGQLAFKVWGPADRSREVAYKSPTSFASRVWPIDDSLARWPPGRVLDDDGVTELWDFDPRSGKASKAR